MLGKEKYGSIVNLVMNITIGTVLSVVGLSLSGKITGVALLQNILIRPCLKNKSCTNGYDLVNY